ncbi:MAG TPA: hypothetical protein VMU16_09980 [Candidatus Binataceae bacterium]|nr:hypothetical protein [Candidatus Binataceae bacterium]
MRLSLLIETRAIARRRLSGLSAIITLAAAISAMLAIPMSDAWAIKPKPPQVLLVGTYNGIPGEFSDIQSAVNAAHPGDWILVGPGDYHERGDYTNAWSSEAGGGVYITTPGIHLRGMNRNTVVVDGTIPGAPQCSSNPSDQDPGPNGIGRNGVLVWKASGVSVENLTSCNFLDGSGGGGNEIWWNGGDDSGVVGLGAYFGQYLSATTTYYQDDAPSGQYGIFVSNSSGPGLIIHTYASNMADSSYYIGACPNCNATLNDAHAENSALGYSGTNSGGHLTITKSEFDNNKTGISTNSELGDSPSPQYGHCPAGQGGPNGNGLCTYFIGNYIHDNNNPNTPRTGSADLGPVGTGMVVAGGRFDSITRNRVEHNGSWGLLLVPFPDTGEVTELNNCAGGVIPQLTDPFPLNLLAQFGVTCFFDDFGNQVSRNSMRHNGFFGNDTNGDLGDISGLNDPGNCWFKNTDPNGLTTSPANLQVTNGQCGIPNQGASFLDPLTEQVICATGVFEPCSGLPGNPGYPQPTEVALIPLPKQKTMPNPCQSVPNNPWCPAR